MGWIILAVLGSLLAAQNPIPLPTIPAKEVAVVAQETKQLAVKVERVWDELHTQLKQNLKRTEELAKRIEQAPDEDKLAMLGDVVKELEEITNAFESIAQKREQIESKLTSMVLVLDRFPQDTAQRIKELEQRKAELLGQISELQKIKSAESEIRIKSREARIRALERQIQFWTDFKKVQDGISRKTGDTAQKINLLLVAIEENGLVYRDELETIKLYGDLQRALSLVADIPMIAELTEEIVASWETVDGLVKTLTDQAAKLFETYK